MQLPDIKIVLVEPTHPGNIGSVARAMKTMGITSLALVNPKKFPHYEASKLAAGAESVLEEAHVYERLEDALKETTLVLGTSVRDREVSWPTLSPKEVADAAYLHTAQSENASIAILFGRESSGLTNEELGLCQSQIRIDANPDYSSLNLASAVQIIAYELRMKWLGMVDQKEHQQEESLPTSLEKRQLAATRDQLEGHLNHLQSTLEALDFIKVKPPTVLMRKLSRLYGKAQLTVEEIQILRGILSAVDQKLK